MIAQPVATVGADQFVAYARSWIDVPFRHQGRSRDGVDCAGLVIAVAHGLGLSNFDTRDYKRIPDGASLVAACDAQMRRLAPHDPWCPAQVLVMRFLRDPQHLAILARHPRDPAGWSLIHSLEQVGRVGEQPLDEQTRHRVLRRYAVPGVAY